MTASSSADDAQAVSLVVDAACAGRGDADVRAYVAICLADEDFDWEEEVDDDGDTDLLAAAVAKASSSPASTSSAPPPPLLAAASAVRAAFGEMLSGSGCCICGEDEARVCAELALKLCPKKRSGSGGSSDGTGTGGGGGGGGGGAAAAPGSRGPILLDDLDKLTIHASERLEAKDAIRIAFPEAAGVVSSAVASEKDLAKLRKREEAAHAAARAAADAHSLAAASAARGSKPTIRRNAGAGGARDLRLGNVCVSNGGSDLIRNADLLLAAGRRYGLVGKNGAGKSTLLRALAAREVPGIPPNMQILHVEAEVPGDKDATPLDVLLEADAERAELLEEEAELLRRLGGGGGAGGGGGGGGVDPSAPDAAAAAPDAAAPSGSGDEGEEGQGQGDSTSTAATSARLSAVSARLQEIDAAGAPARAASILSGLSFDAASMTRPTASFSGGWRMRISLARALFCAPDVLCLDEPTCHLDLHSVLWLEDYLCSYPGTVVVVSHARDFLNAVCTDVIHLARRTLAPYRGNFSTFVSTAAERKINAAKAAASASARRDHMQAFVDKFRFNAKRASLVQSRIKAIERIDNGEDAGEDANDAGCCSDDSDDDDEEGSMTFRFPDPGAVPSPIVSFRDAAFRYSKEDPWLLKGLDFSIDAGTRVALVGANGAGKSTLLGLMSGRLDPEADASSSAAARRANSGGDGGRVERSSAARVATFAQHAVDGLDVASTPLGALRKVAEALKAKGIGGGGGGAGGGGGGGAGGGGGGGGKSKNDNDNGTDRDSNKPQSSTSSKDANNGAPADRFSDQGLRGHLGSFSISGPLATQRIYTLSGGQKVRVALAAATLARPHLLLLDEPSNFLDMVSVDALISGLRGYKGAVVLISHDAYLLQAVAPDALWVVERGRVERYKGSFAEYRSALRAAASAEKARKGQGGGK